MSDKAVERSYYPSIGVVGLGYVGLPAALAFAEKYHTIGYDIDKGKVDALKLAIDLTGEVDEKELKDTTLQFTNQIEALSVCDYIIIAVPTPIDADKKPDLSYIKTASDQVGKHMKRGAIIIYESTVYPGATEEVCLPLLASASGFEVGSDFSIGYSPERINPGDKENTFKTIGKIISGYDVETLDKIEQLYCSVLDAPVYRASTIKVAEAAKIVENAQRDINIAFMNELSQLFDQLNINFQDVLAVAKTKWNFLDFKPGLVGGHCIGVDPYYLITKAEDVYYHPSFLKEARRINESMIDFVIERVQTYADQQQRQLSDVKVHVLGVAFKENVADLRNAKAIEIIKKLKQLDVNVMASDPLVSPLAYQEITGDRFVPISTLWDADVIMLLVPHQPLVTALSQQLSTWVQDKPVLLIDLKAVLNQLALPNHLSYWCL
ncbi:nucleotide sugar dehydrogenase [Amphibacillus jilinensis]|uniref:nucleotide sugar dehydrogenase n=1 Tax=Amphibacillus jilinensis TaxID=1216008 RepID=UPI0002D325F1|nr:nucleotide sugar dehydrogenase [Amphibacillus jilinensis]